MAEVAPADVFDYLDWRICPLPGDPRSVVVRL